jgi:hypothetical protein
VYDVRASAARVVDPVTAYPTMGKTNELMALPNVETV